MTALLRATEKEADEIARAIRQARGIVAVKLAEPADEVDRQYQALTVRNAELQESLGWNCPNTI